MTNNTQLNDAKFRISFSLAELQVLQHFLSLPSSEIDALDILPLVSKIRKAELKASVGITLPAYSGKTSAPGVATIARIANDEKFAKGEELLNRVRSGGAQSADSSNPTNSANPANPDSELPPLTETETYLAMAHLIETLGKTPETEEEKEAMATYLHVKVFGASQA